MGEPCFTYGSLMCEDIMFAVCGHRSASSDATLGGYSRHPVRDEDYPALRPAVGATVAGRLYHPIGESALRRLDVFEGEMYSRELLPVATADGNTVEAWTYVFRPQFRSLLLPGDWDFEAFLRDGRRRFEARYLGFQQIRQ